MSATTAATGPLATEAVEALALFYADEATRPTTLTGWGLEVAATAGEVARATARNRRTPCHAFLRGALLHLIAAAFGALVHLDQRTLR